MRPSVFIPEPIEASGLELLKEDCDLLVPWDGDISPPADFHFDGSITPTLYEVDAIIVRLLKISAEDISQARRLKVIGRHGVGVDNIDCQAATDAGIPIVYTPNANADSVAEHTLALMLALSRQITSADAAVREGRFHERLRYQGVELAEKTLGVIGLGRVGSRVARMAAIGLRMTVFAYDPFVPGDTYSGPAIIQESLEAVIRKSDYLTLHVALTPATRHLINEQTLNWAKRGCRIINTSRGAVIDEGALLAAVKGGRLAGVALDVFEEEPLPAKHPLCSAPNTLLTPHISSSTKESLERMSLHVAQGVLDVLSGRAPDHVANPEVLA